MRRDTVTFRATYNVIEGIEPEALAADFLTFDAVQSVADRERPIEQS